MSVRVILSASALALAFLWMMMAGVKAHNVQVIRTEPASGATLEQTPAQIAMMFNAELMSPASTIQVFNAAGQQVDLGDGGVDLTDPEHATLIVHLPAVGEDAYTIRWHIVRDDGDTTAGEFSFTVGTGARNRPPLEMPSAISRSLASMTVLWGAAGVALLTAFGLFWRRRFV